MPGPVASSVFGFLSNFSEDGLPATKLIFAICVLVFALSMASDALSGGTGSHGFGLMGFSAWTSLRFGALLGPPIIGLEPWRVLSAVFLHASGIHIVMNMLSLMNLGRTLEPHFRSGRFLLLYLLSGMLGFCATVWWRGEHAFSVGASGAIFGLLGAFIGALVIRRNPGWQRVFMSNLIMAFALAYFVPNVDNSAHAGGFISGFLLGILLELERQPRKRDRLVTGLAAVGVVAVIASIALSASSPVWKAQRRAEEARAERAERSHMESE